MAESPHNQTQEATALPVSRFMAAALGRHCGFDGERRTRFEGIAARLTAALSQGHICLELSGEERKIMRRSPLVGDNRHGPLVLSGSRLYFGRYFRYESELAAALKRLAARKNEHGQGGLPAETIEALVDDAGQRKAIEIALDRAFSIISGGPGTGKTTLIVKIISLLQARCGSGLRIALAAPTGKAAVRMQDAIQQQAADPGLAAERRRLSAAPLPTQALTLHRLLGIGRFSRQPVYHRAHPLAEDVIIIDEASMIDLAMMWKLVNGLKQGARLILLGDRDQLASVESGAVLADCIDSLPDNVARLTKSYRFSTAIGRFAEAVRSGDDRLAWECCALSGDRSVATAGSDWLDQVLAAYGAYMAQAASCTDPQAYAAILDGFNRYRVLCALRRGPRGVEEINRRIESRLAGPVTGRGGDWYRGRPVIITRNDHGLGLYNGDIGICLPDPAADGELRVWFDAANGGLRSFIPGQLPAHETAWAMTIHKSQGSEFNEVLLVFPESDNQILCRELLYTGLTRARTTVSLVISEDILRTAVSRKTARHSGLAQRLAGAPA